MTVTVTAPRGLFVPLPRCQCHDCRSGVEPEDRNLPVPVTVTRHSDLLMGTDSESLWQ